MNCYAGKPGRRIDVIQPGLIFADVQQKPANSLNNGVCHSGLRVRLLVLPMCPAAHLWLLRLSYVKMSNCQLKMQGFARQFLYPITFYFSFFFFFSISTVWHCFCFLSSSLLSCLFLISTPGYCSFIHLWNFGIFEAQVLTSYLGLLLTARSGGWSRVLLFRYQYRVVVKC